MIRVIKMIEALYVHIPFCKTKCHYCDFISYPYFDDDLKTRYVEALKKECIIIENKLKEDIKLKSIFLGGGTPTCLSSGLLLDLLLFIKDFFPLQSQTEITVEANPNTLDENKVDLLLRGGVNRVSLGVQSFNQRLLKNVGREQDIESIYYSVELLRKKGLKNLNLDLMYGLPGQNIEHWEETLRSAINLNPEHVSAYQLKIEENTPLGEKLLGGKIKEFDDEKALEMYKATRRILGENGYQQYEVSNYAKVGFESVHNKVYWLSEPYLSLGAGAHSYLPPSRIENLGDVKGYITNLEANNLPPREEEFQDTKTSMSEFVFMGLRMLEGIELARFQAYFHKRLEDVFPRALEKCLRWGLIQIDKGHLRLTDEGLYLGNLVFQEFLLD